MADYDIKLNTNQLVDVLSKNDAIKGLLESVLNQVLASQMTEHLGAERHEQTDERVGYRNGTRVRELYTRVGPLNLQVPQTRDGSFKTEVFKRYQRSEQAFVLGIMEMYLEGVSCRKVTKITEQLCGPRLRSVPFGATLDEFTLETSQYSLHIQFAHQKLIILNKFQAISGSHGQNKAGLKHHQSLVS